MNEHYLSVSLLVRQAARNLHRLELMAGNTAWSSNPFYRQEFWHVQRMMARMPDEAAAWLPALAITLHQKQDCYVLDELGGAA